MALKEGMIERFRKALPVLSELEKDLEWIENEFSLSNSTEEERSQVQHIRNMACRPFDETVSRLKTMNTPINLKGHLFLNEEGRYQIEGTNQYFTCGNSCEVFLPFYDDEEEYFTWIPTSIEFKNDKYYFTARPNVAMDGALVRTRG